MKQHKKWHKKIGQWCTRCKRYIKPLKENKIKKMVKSELKSLSKIKDVSESMKQLDKLENNYKRINIYRPGSAKYYKDQLKNIRAVGIDFDGCNIKSAKQMRDLVMELCQMAKDALDHEKLYIQVEEIDNVS